MNPFGWVVLKTLLLRGHNTKFKMFFSNQIRRGSQVSAYISFHSVNADGKTKEVRKKLLLTLK